MLSTIPFITVLHMQLGTEVQYFTIIPYLNSLYVRIYITLASYELTQNETTYVTVIC